MMMPSNNFDDPYSNSFDAPYANGSPSYPADFCHAVAAQLQARGYTVVRWVDDGVHILSPTSPNEQYLGLNNLYRRLTQAIPAEHLQLIHQFLDHLDTIQTAPPLPTSLDTVTAQLRPRLGPPFLHDSPLRPWSRPWPGTPLTVSLVIDLPTTMVYVTDDMVHNSQATPDQLFQCAVDNLRQDTNADFLQPVDDDLDLLLGHSGDGYDASRALFIESLLPRYSPAGVWLALPSRDELYVWPVNPTSLKYLPQFKRAVERHYRQHPYPISDELFWVYHKRWYTFPIHFDAPDTVSITPPPEFLSLLPHWHTDSDSPPLL